MTAPALPVAPADRALLEEIVRAASSGPWAGGPYDRARYAAATGRTPDPGMLVLYRLRWALDDVADFVA
ncbi:hypothetical protein SAMN05421874_14512 [Nonomuraea maritima]|uniref:Uncharacterized protein n=1 Tax=Nonomuraea maritima TaxID=683260 RepID=A0A1G9RE45_9ACTN|nr:hypothetical protein [Nonomuraea maritima]SDM21518.1 hypothetical protein SAMN05421874_14512 [Nonomuraea maritima]